MAKRDRYLLVDADVLRYQIAFANQDDVQWDGEDGESVALTNPKKAGVQVESFILELQERFNTDKLVIVLSGRDRCFREELDETYKANRKDKPKPVLWGLVSDYLEWGDHGHRVVEQKRLEGDDVLGVLHTGEYLDRSVILTIDKDMLTVPGLIYRWNKPDDEAMDVQSHRDAAMFHLTQVLTGDTVDNYKGCPGIGPVKADSIRKQCDTPLEFWEAIVETYAEYIVNTINRGKVPAFDHPTEAALHQARLAFILRHGWYNPDNHKVKLWTPKQLRGL